MKKVRGRVLPAVKLGKGKGKSLPFSGVHRLTQTDPLIETVYSNSLFLTSLQGSTPLSAS